MDVPTCAGRRSRWAAGALVLCGTALLFGSPAASADSPGALYTETNAAHNQIVAFDRKADGTIVESQRIDTGGAGSPTGNPPFPQNHLDAVNEIELTDNGRLLFAVNAGDNTISSFRVGPHGHLSLADRVSSGGNHPVSLDSRNGLLYVLNELDQTGHDVVGFVYLPDGRMFRIPGSTRQLSTPFAANNGFGFPSPLADQVLFSPDGRELTVPERTSNGFQGQIDTFALNFGGLVPSQSHANPSNAFIPFGMEWDNHGHLIVANGGTPLVNPPFPGSGSSYSLSGTTLTAIDNKPTNANGTCWVSITNNGKYAFMSDQNTAQVSRFAIARNGVLTLLGNVSTSGPSADTALSGDSRFLYVINVLSANGAGGATIDEYRVKNDGDLVHIGVVDAGIPDSASGLAAR
jgi:6-phosphogluconolactonase